jgi:DNA invertase Pin-like site-specific DNA recombinase
LGVSQFKANDPGREELKLLLTFLREGDCLVVTRIDRLARSVCDLALIVRDLEARGISLRATEQDINTSTPAGRAFLQMLGPCLLRSRAISRVGISGTAVTTSDVIKSFACKCR